MRQVLLASLPLAVALLVGAVGCSDSTSPDAEPGGVGRLKLNLVDAPGDFDQVNLVVVGVRVHRAGDDSLAGWHDVGVDTFTVDLLTLTDGQGVVIADTLLPAGDYTQVRLLLGDGCHVVADGDTHPLEVPSGGTSGLKLNHPFTLAPGTLHEATLDFDAHRSIHVTGNGRWMMKPVIRIVVDAISGGLRGVVSPAAARAAVWAVADGDSALAFADTLTGAFAFPMLLAGTYEVTFTAAEGSYADSTVAGVEVAAGAWTDLGTVELEEVVVAPLP
jgi:hypothetical protein